MKPRAGRLRCGETLHVSELVFARCLWRIKSPTGSYDPPRVCRCVSLGLGAGLSRRCHCTCFRAGWPGSGRGAGFFVLGPSECMYARQLGVSHPSVWCASAHASSPLEPSRSVGMLDARGLPAPRGTGLDPPEEWPPLLGQCHTKLLIALTSPDLAPPLRPSTQPSTSSSRSPVVLDLDCHCRPKRPQRPEERAE